MTDCISFQSSSVMQPRPPSSLGVIRWLASFAIESWPLNSSTSSFVRYFCGSDIEWPWYR